MSELAVMLQSCKMLSKPVADGYLEKVAAWFSSYSQPNSLHDKILANNSKPASRPPTKRTSNLQRPMTGTQKTLHVDAERDRPSSAALGSFKYKLRPASSAFTGTTMATRKISLQKKNSHFLERQRSEESRSSSRRDES